MTTREEFGKYLLLKKLSDDPLGETFRAGRLGQQGVEQVVLLRVLNGQGLDGDGLWKALSARQEVQSALKSPNIGSGVDAERVRGVPYVAYDYISGKDLATLSAQARSEGSPFPTDHALLIADRVGLALTAAYETRHGGQRVHHGMVVPHLVMISNEGETRLLGFEAGPALAAQAGALPEGIRRYLAPEVRNGGGPTKTSDIFSLGAILFELLTGKPLPDAPGGDYSGVIAQARLASEGTALPEGVANLLGRSLGAPDARLPDPSSWHKALSKIMSEGGYNATTFNLAFFMHNLFREEIERESKEIEAEKTLDLPRREARVAPAGAETMRLPQEEVRKAAAAPASAPPDDTGAVKARYGMEEEPAKSGKGLWIGLAAAIVAAALGVGGWFLFARQPAPPPDAEPEADVAAAQVPAPEPAPEPVDLAAPIEPEPEEPEEDEGAEQDEIQNRIDALFEDRADAMEANIKAEYDQRIEEMQRELEEAQRAADRARREETDRREAEAARRAAAAEEPEPEPEPAPTRTASQPAPQDGGGSNDPSGSAAEPADGTEAQEQAASTKQAPAEPAPPPPPAPEPTEPQVKRGELVSSGPGVSAPRLLHRASPDYPPVAARLGKEASVEVRVLVDENGEVIEAEVDGRKAGFGFDQEAVRAARASTFAPATKLEVPVKMWTTVRFVFRK